MSKHKKIEALAILCCPYNAQNCSFCNGQHSCSAYAFATKAIESGYGLEKEAVSLFMGQVLAMPEQDKAKAMKQRFKKLYR